MEFDYFGRPTTTLSRDEIEREMEDIIIDFLYREDDLVLTQENSADNLRTGFITPQQETDLMKHAYDLFKLLPTDKDISEAIRGLVKEVSKWSNGNIMNEWQKQRLKEIYPTLKKKPRKERAATLQKNIKSIYDLVNEKRIPDEVKQFLDTLSLQAIEYVGSVTHKVEVTDRNVHSIKKLERLDHKSSKENIRNYLMNIKPKIQTNAIDNLLKDLT